jgi:hypothetical protein
LQIKLGQRFDRVDDWIQQRRHHDQGAGAEAFEPGLQAHQAHGQGGRQGGKFLGA